MTKTRATYGREFKLDALRLVETSGKSIPQIERDLGMQAFPGQGHLTPEQEELRRLKRENVVLRPERDIQTAHPDRYPDKTAPPECGRIGREGS